MCRRWPRLGAWSRGGGAPSPLHGSGLGGVGVAEVVAVGAVAAAVLVRGDVELAHLGAAHPAGAALLSLAAGLAAPSPQGPESGFFSRGKEMLLWLLLLLAREESP